MRGRAIPAAYVAAAAIVMGVVWRTLFETERVLSVVVNMAQEGGALAAVLLLGEAVRSRRASTEETRERLRLSREAQEREATRRVIQERLRFARDLHDVVAHTVTVIGVQANGGHGIRGMRERAASLGGVLTTEPAVGGGFLVTAIFPMGAPS